MNFAFKDYYKLYFKQLLQYGEYTNHNNSEASLVSYDDSPLYIHLIDSHLSLSLSVISIAISYVSW